MLQEGAHGEKSKRSGEIITQSAEKQGSLDGARSTVLYSQRNISGSGELNQDRNKLCIRNEDAPGVHV